MASRATQGDLFAGGISALSHFWDAAPLSNVLYPSDAGQDSAPPSTNFFASGDPTGLPSGPAPTGSYPYPSGADSTPLLSDFFGSDGPTGAPIRGF